MKCKMIRVQEISSSIFTLSGGMTSDGSQTQIQPAWIELEQFLCNCPVLSVMHIRSLLRLAAFEKPSCGCRMIMGPFSSCLF